MANANEAQAGIPWYSWVGLAIVFAFGGATFYQTNSLVLPDWLRWGVTGVWITVTLVLGIMDFFINTGPDASRDEKPFDRWTISHGGAGLVFGIWFMPLLFVLLLTVFWELFEWSARGFGDKEVVLNRAVDVGIAVVLWLLVVLIVVAVMGAPFPLVTPYKHST